MANADQLQAFLEEFGPNAGLVEEMLEEYLKNPAAVSKSWQQYFAGIVQPHNGNGTKQAPSASQQLPSPSPTLHQQPESPSPDQATAIRGVAAKIVENMEASLALPTATSVRTIPVKVLEENRRLLNQYLSI